MPKDREAWSLGGFLNISTWVASLDKQQALYWKSPKMPCAILFSEPAVQAHLGVCVPREGAVVGEGWAVMGCTHCTPMGLSFGGVGKVLPSLRCWKPLFESAPSASPARLILHVSGKKAAQKQNHMTGLGCKP